MTNNALEKKVISDAIAWAEANYLRTDLSIFEERLCESVNSLLCDNPLAGLEVIEVNGE